MNTGLEMVRTRGRKASALEVELIGALSEAELIVANHTERGAAQGSLQRLRDTHHHLARLLADGLTNSEASAITGFCPSRISTLRSDPAFAELLEFYRTRAGEVYVNVHERLKLVALEATSEIHERLVNTPEVISIGQLLEVAKLGHDRTGFGPQSKAQIQTTFLSADDLRQMKEELSRAETGNVIQRAPQGDRPQISGTIIDIPVGEAETPQSCGEEGTGI